MAQVRAAGMLGNIPLIVVSHDPGDPTDNFMKAMEKAWDESQQGFTRLSTDSSRVIAKRSHHNIQLDRPDVVIASIHKVVEDAGKEAHRVINVPSDHTILDNLCRLLVSVRIHRPSTDVVVEAVQKERTRGERTHEISRGETKKGPVAPGLWGVSNV